MAMQNKDSVQKLYNKKMRDVTRNAFGKDYLDTDTHECQHIRDLFKDWDTQIYSSIHNQDISKEKTHEEIANHIHRYDQSLKKQIENVKKNGFDITKYRKSTEFMYN
jgi:hypothetical protein